MDELFPGATPTDETYATYRAVMAGFGALGVHTSSG